jgi:general secretion pathway protein I
MNARNKGFSLLEILVAFAIMAVALTIVLRIFGSGVNSAVTSEDYTLAVQIAESLMARTGVETPLQVGEWSGQEADKYEWRVIVSALPLPTQKRPRFESDDNNEQKPLQLMRVRVEVSWGEDAPQRRVLALQSLKLLNPEDS